MGQQFIQQPVGQIGARPQGQLIVVAQACGEVAQGTGIAFDRRPVTGVFQGAGTPTLGSEKINGHLIFGIGGRGIGHVFQKAPPPQTAIDRLGDEAAVAHP